jgi:hypothetical protein
LFGGITLKTILTVVRGVRVGAGADAGPVPEGGFPLAAGAPAVGGAPVGF